MEFITFPKGKYCADAVDVTAIAARKEPTRSNMRVVMNKSPSGGAIPPQDRDTL
jgi:hypothetical protein